MARARRSGYAVGAERGATQSPRGSPRSTRKRRSGVTRRSLPREQELSRPVEVGLDRVLALAEREGDVLDRAVVQVVQDEEPALVLAEPVVYGVLELREALAALEVLEGRGLTLQRAPQQIDRFGLS